MKKKTVGPSQVQVEVWKALRYIDIKWLKDLFNKVIVEGKMLNEWRKSVIIPTFKSRGNIQECSNNRGIS